MKFIHVAKISIALLLLNIPEIQAQNLFTIGDKDVTTNEFLYVYGKNKDIGNQIDPKTAVEYLELYVRFKRKVVQAEVEGRDTLESFKNEFNNYYRQLLKPYLTDKEIDDQIIAEAYDRLKLDVRASHIMLDLPKDPSPSDTLRIFKKIMSLKGSVENGENFEDVARLKSTDTYSAKNGGDLGYFTVFNMVYPFENASYNATLGELVGPIRTDYGYHILKVTDKRDSRYRMSAAHILLLDSKDQPKETAKAKINEIYNRLLAGESFNMLARKYSEDQSSVSKGGELPDFGLNKMLPEFEDAVYGINEDGDYSKPFKTKLGWHIVKRLKKYQVPEFDRVKAEVTSKIRRDERSSISRKAFISRLKNRYDLKVNNASLEAVVKAIRKGKKISKYKRTIFSFEGMTERITFNQLDFAEIFKKRLSRVPDLSEYLVLESAIENALMKEAELRLPNENSEFKFLAQEYREGILVFDLTREKVWDAASKDSAIIMDFFIENKDNYKWNARRSGSVFNTSNTRVAKKALAMLQRGIPGEKVLRVLNSKDPLAISAQDFEKLEMGRNTSSLSQGRFLGVKDSELISGVALIEHSEGFTLVHVIESIAPGLKTLSDCRGQVISDLQDFLENEWDKELMASYPLIWNESEWKRIQSQL